MSILGILLEITVYSALIFCFIMLFKKLFGKHISPSLHYCIWLLLIVRLIMPVTIDSGLNLFTIPAESVPVSENVQASTADVVNTDIYIPDESISETSNNAVTDFSRQSNGIHQPRVSAEPAAAKPFNWSTLLLYVWITGAALSISYLFWSYIYLKKRIRKSAVSPNAVLSDIFHQCVRELGIKRNIRMVLQEEISSPALLVFPVMLIPADIMQTMDKQQIAFAVKHELMHYRRKDHIVCLLLSLLQAVYWFNPFVWLAYRQIRMDMETACDSMVVKAMDVDERLKYAETVLSLFSRKKQLPVMLGMAVVNTKKTAEKRLKGIYMKQKSNRKGRFAVAMLVCVMLITCFTTACQPTPENTAVVGNADGLPSQALNKEIDENPLPDVPEKWSDTVELNDNCKITIDAEIELPDTDIFPVYRLERNELAQERLDELINYFVPNGKFYNHDVFTKEYYEQRLIEAKRGQFVDGKYVPPPADDPGVKSIEQKLANAPSANEMTPIGTDFNYYSDYDGNIDESRGKNFLDINFTTEDGKSGSIFAMRYEMGNAVDNRFGLNTNINWMTQSLMETQPEISEEERQYYTSEDLAANDSINQLLEDGFFDNFTLKQDQAVDQANKVIADLGIDSMGIVYVEKVMIDRYSGMAGFSDTVAQDQGYVIDYARRLDAIDGFIDNESMSNPEGDDNQDAYAPPFAMETITMVISESGIEYFGWGEMAQKAETVSENSELLPFEEIKERIVNQLKYENIVDADSGMSIEININKIQLLSGYINVKDDIDSVWHIPVWVAQGSMICTRENGESEEYGLGSTVINALDGGRVLGQDGSRFTS